MYLRSSFIAAFISVTLLGSAGMHGVLEWLGTCSHQHHCCSHGDSHSHTHGHHHSHSHQHSGTSDKCPGQTDSENQQQPHDSENCAVCTYYSLIAEPTVLVELPSLIESVDHAPLPAYEGWVVTFIKTFDRRGPPTA